MPNTISKEKNPHWHQHENLVFYAKDAWDIEYNYPGSGYDELMGIHDRSDYDLTQHEKPLVQTCTIPPATSLSKFEQTTDEF